MYSRFLVGQVLTSSTHTDWCSSDADQGRPSSATIADVALMGLLQNLVQGKLVNGSVGKVIEFSTYQSAKEQGVQVPQQEGEKQQPSKYANDPKSRVWPIVQFTNGQTIICSPEEFTVNNASGEMEAKREQVNTITRERYPVLTTL